MKGKFLGDTKGNRTNPTNMSSDRALGAGGESHKPCTNKGEFIGHTKGNTDVPPNRTQNTAGNFGGKGSTSRRGGG